jgi:GTP-binding protein EngB required for normal cell division
MSIVERLRRSGKVDADALVARVDALRRFVQAAEGNVPESSLVTARTAIDRAGERLALSKSHTVVALAGATGSGKSSLFNAMAKFQISRVGMRRPTTGVAHACVWDADPPQDPLARGSQALASMQDPLARGLQARTRMGGSAPPDTQARKGAAQLLDWLSVPPNRRFNRESALDGDDEQALRGLVLLDLPDFDSVEASHRVEVDRLLRLVDLVVWVMDPQKYADKVVHQRYLTQFQRHRDITVVVLNQADRLSRADAERCVADLRRLLAGDGLDGVPVFPTSAKGHPGLDQLRSQLENAVADRQAALNRLAGDVANSVEKLQPLVGIDITEDRIDRASVNRLAEALSVAAGVPIVADATERTYRHRAAGVLGWPVARWLRRVRPDPLRRLHLDRGARPADRQPNLPAVTSLPESTVGQRASVAMASRTVAEQVSTGLPEPWPEAVLAASRARLRDVPDALDVAVASADLGMASKPAWWRLVGALQWLGALAALAGLTWLVVRYFMLFIGLPDLRGPAVGRLPLPTVLLLGGLLFGLLLSIVVRPVVRLGARRARAQAERRLRTAIAGVAADFIVAPIRDVLRSYADARRALASAADGPDKRS